MSFERNVLLVLRTRRKYALRQDMTKCIREDSRQGSKQGAEQGSNRFEVRFKT